MWDGVEDGNGRARRESGDGVGERMAGHRIYLQ